MKKKRFSEEQITGILREAERGEKNIADLCKEHGVSEQSFYRWKAKYDGVFPRIGLDLHAVAQEFIDSVVAVVEAFAGVAGCLAEEVERALDDGGVIAALLECGGQELGLDIAVAAAVDAGTVSPIAEEGIAELFDKQRNDALLRFLLDLPDSVHIIPLRV